MKSLFFLLALLFFFPLGFLFSQRPGRFPEINPAGKGMVDTRIDNIGYWKEMVKMEYVIPTPRNSVPKGRFTGSIIMAPGITPQNSPDIPVTDSLNTTQSENSIFIEPENEEGVLSSNNSTDWIGNYAENSWGADALFSGDYGQSWEGALLGTGRTNNGDPAAAISFNGWRYIGRINFERGQSIAYSKDQGKNWSNVTIASVPTDTYGILDKNHLWVDNAATSPFRGFLYAGWTNFVTGSTDSAQIQISRSSDGGLSWSTPLGISSNVQAGNFNHGVNIQTGPDGEVYSVWSIYDSWPSDEHALGFAKSVDGGGAFAPAQRIIDNIKGIRLSLTGKHMRVNSFPSMAVDLSSGPGRGTIYVVWTNIGFPGVNTGSDMDIYLIKSTDQGQSWSSPAKVNQDPAGAGKQQFFPWITCDPVTGGICVVYYDDRNVSSTECETFVSYSYDGGLSWADFKVSDVSFTPVPIPGLAFDYFGDYIGIQSQNMKVYPAWTDNRDGRAMTYLSPFDLGPNPGQPWVVYYSNELSPIPKKSRQDLNFGDSLFLTIGLKNIGDQPAENLTAYLSSPSPYINLTDTIAIYGSMDASEIKTIPNGFSFKASDTIPDGTGVRFNVRVIGSDTAWYSHFSIESHAPGLNIMSMRVLDNVGGNGNGRIDPGEIVSLVVTTANTGDFICSSVGLKLFSDSFYLTLQNDSIFLGNLDPGQEKEGSFTITASPDTPVSTGIDLLVKASSGKYRLSKYFYKIIGMILEDWESGNFFKFPWQPGGYLPWTTTTNNPWEGVYCSRSGKINYSKKSDMSIEYASAADDTISFYLKTSSEPDYDFLLFYIDSVFHGSWSGETPWTRVAFPVSAGHHQYKWSYEKDLSYDVGEDCSWLDYIVFPVPSIPFVDPGPDDTICSGETFPLHATASEFDSVQWQTSGDGSFSQPDSLDPVYSPGPEDQLTDQVSLNITAFGRYGNTTRTLHLTIKEFPQVSIITFPSDTLCAGQTMYLSVDTTGNTSYHWTPGNFLAAEILIDTAITGGIGSFLFRVDVVNIFGCMDSDSILVNFKDCTGLHEPEGVFTTEVYPNPNQGTFRVQIKRPGNDKISIMLLDSRSVVCYKASCLGFRDSWEKIFDFSYLPAGIYFLSIDYNEGSVKQKVVILK
ncbi:MAG: T9SS type A sorting domain-containing protein [bacterium]